MRLFAIPLRVDGQTKLGTLGVVSGEYQSVANFIRYNRKYLTNPHGYSIEQSHGGGSFTRITTYKADTQ